MTLTVLEVGRCGFLPHCSSSLPPLHPPHSTSLSSFILLHSSSLSLIFYTPSSSTPLLFLSISIHSPSLPILPSSHSSLPTLKLPFNSLLSSSSFTLSFPLTSFTLPLLSCNLFHPSILLPWHHLGNPSYLHLFLFPLLVLDHLLF